MSEGIPQIYAKKLFQKAMPNNYPRKLINNLSNQTT